MELHTLIHAYSGSKVLRMGTAYMETETRLKALLCDDTGISDEYLRKYATIARHYFPKKVQKYSEWTDAEDNFLMGNYQVKTLKKICECLPDRTRNTIIKRAMFLGVTKSR